MMNWEVSNYDELGGEQSVMMNWEVSSYDELGVVTPDDPKPFVGENLTLFCNLTKHTIQENSSRLYFSHNGDRIGSQYVDIINSRTIRLRYPVTTLDDEGLFMCWLNNIHNDQETVGMQFVQTDYQPVNVTSVNCTVYNWKNMTCRWDLRRNYKHKENMEVSLVWTISGIQKDCPILTPTSCTWPGQLGHDHDVTDMYLPGSVYIMTVQVVNKARQVSATSNPPFRIVSSQFVKPDAVRDLHVSGKNATCLNLTWTHSDRTSRKLALVQYFSEWNQGNWTNLPLKPFRSRGVRVSICDLTPFTDYTIRIGVWPEGRPGQQVGFRSDWEYKTVRTDSSVPEVGPAMCTGCFTDLPSTSDQRKIIIYWKHIPWPLRYSTIRGYHLHIPESNANSTVANCNFTDANNTSCLLALQPDRAYTLQLYAITMKNERSRSFSAIHLTSIAQKPPAPSSFVVETQRKWNASTGEFYLRWSGQPNTWRYQDEPEWEDLAGDATQFTLSVKRREKNLPRKGDNQEDYLVGVSRQVMHDGHIVSSGIVWARCIYLQGEVPMPPENVNFAEVQRAGSLSVIWDRGECSTNNVYILRYVVYYCQTDTNNKCKGKVRKANVTDNNSILLDNLEPGMYYRVSVSAVSEWGEGQQSQPPIYARVTTAEQVEESTNYAIIGVILAVFVIIILILIGICKLRRHYVKNREKFGSLGNLPPLPHGRSFTAEKEPSNYKNRPLPQIPPQPSASGTTNTTSVSMALVEACTCRSVDAVECVVCGIHVAGTCSSQDCPRWPQLQSDKLYSSCVQILISSVLSPKGLGSDLTHSNNHRNRNGKHKSITSETSLLGHEDSFTAPDDDTRRRHRSGTSGASEKAKLLPEEGKVIREKQQSSKRDSDSGTESRYSSDHDYASVDSGGASSGRSVAREDSDGVNAACSYRGNGKGYMCKDASSAAVEKGGNQRTYKAAPGFLPSHQRDDYMLAALSAPDTSLFHLQQQQSMDGSGVLQQQERQPLLTTFGTSRPNSHTLPVHQVRLSDTGDAPGRAVSSTPYQPAGGPHLIDDRTLPLRPPGTRPKHIKDTELDLLSTTLPLSSAPSSSAGSKVQHPQWRSQAAVLPMVELVSPTVPTSTARGYTPQAAIPAVGATGNGVISGNAGNSTSGEASEPIYSPPWGSNGLISIVTDNRPLSEYMLQLPQNFFHEPALQVHEGPTTEL
ncbi:hypothetical protein BaRGS_00023522 [Batillaria attramentaria]|uniref:Fibronectin type-III domain-containing protein n=1 Tax=Batillaria attramentaria TaxID=370345 RepID=A0ABD0KE30_9CAEN